MTTYPLSTLAPTVNSTGIFGVTIDDIFASFQSSIQNIFGSDVVIDPSSQDGQFIGIMSKIVSDCGQAVIGAYNQFSPATAVGAGLSSVVKINGIARLVSSNSSAPIQIIGQAGTTIINGIVSDGNYQWALPASFTIPVGGMITETAICLTSGAITALSGTINQIFTPTRGWQSAVSTNDAAVGAPVEDDGTLRARQTISTGLPAQTVLQAIVGAVANLTGVQEVMPYENDTGTTNSLGIPAHSISLVVQGGDAIQIATAIAEKKAPGTGTYGTTSETIVDPSGVPLTISFFVPTQVQIDVNITIKAYSGYVSTTGTLITSQIAAYINSLGIGGTDNFIFNSKLYSPANDTGSLANTYNVTALTARRTTGSYTTSDIAIAFNELPVARTITLTVT